MTDVALRPTALLDQLAAAGAYNGTGLHLAKPEITYEQLESIGTLLAEHHKSVRFAIGDWLLLVEYMFPEKFSQALEVLQMSPEGARDFMRVSEKVPRSIRREKLSWSHHRAVAALEPPEQKQWLNRAEKESLSHHQLRDALRVDEPPAPKVCRCCHRPL